MLDEDRVRRFAAEVAAQGPKRGVPRLFYAIRSGDVPDFVKPGMSVLIQCLCSIGAPWVTGFRASTQQGGSCPQDLREVVKNALELIQKRASKPRSEALQANRAPVAVAQAELVVKDRQELGIRAQQHYLLERINALYAYGGPVDLTLKFECERVYVYGLALIAAWCGRYAAKVTVSATTSTRRYLSQIGFLDVVQTQARIDAPKYDSSNYVALTEILRSRSEEADKIPGRLIDLFGRHMLLDKGYRHGLGVTFAEIVENVYRHAETDYPAYLMAQAHPVEGRLHVVVVDAGIGVYDSFRRSEDAAVRKRASSEREALKMATEAYVTSKTSMHSGYGLYVVSELVARNRGFFKLTSGGNTLLREPGRWGSPRREAFLTHPRWQGTQLGLEFNLAAELPLIDVYNSLERDREDFL